VKKILVIALGLSIVASANTAARNPGYGQMAWGICGAPVAIAGHVGKAPATGQLMACWLFWTYPVNTSWTVFPESVAGTTPIC